MKRVFETSDEELAQRVVAAFDLKSIAHVVSEREDEVGFACWNLDVDCEEVPRATKVIEEIALALSEERSNFRCPRCAGKMLATTHSADEKGEVPLYMELRCRRCGATELTAVQ